MARQITALQRQKRNSERVNVYLDGAYAFSLPALEAVKLRREQYLSDQESMRTKMGDLVDGQPGAPVTEEPPPVEETSEPEQEMSDPS